MTSPSISSTRSISTARGRLCRARPRGADSGAARLRRALHLAGRCVKRPAAYIFINREAVLQRRKRSLLAIEPLAKPASGADRYGRVEIVQLVPIRVYELARIADRASDSHR